MEFMDNDISFNIINDQGIEVTCDVIKSYHDEETGKLYAAFTDYTLDDKDKLRLFIKEVKQNGDNFIMEDITDVDIKNKLVNDVFKNLI